MIKSLLLLTLVFSLSACLRTRSQIQGRNTVTPAGPADNGPVVEASGPIVASQPSSVVNASGGSYDNQLAELQTMMRELVGRVEVLEKNWNMSQNVDELSEFKKQVSAKMALYEEALVRLEKRPSSSYSKPADTKVAAKAGYELAEERFNNKDWKKAILSYQEYRDKNPKGKNYSEATYKIGVCFQELGLLKESKAFYNEVVNKFPNSRTAKKAKYRLGNIK